MAIVRVNGVRLFYQMSGTGEIPLIMVHGSWGSHHNWDTVAPGLARTFRVLTYDRRGHSDSERPAGQGSIREDVTDLAALIEQLGLAPAWVAGNSGGAAVTLRLAAERPDLLRGIIVHEPPLFGLLGEEASLAPMLDQVGRRLGAVAERIAAGDHAGAAEQFVETVALGPGSWARLPDDLQRTFIQNAPTFLDETRDPEGLAFDLSWVRRFPRPALLTKGDQSPAIFPQAIDRIARAMPHATLFTFRGAGHIPHITHPAEYVEQTTAFIHDHP